MPSSTARETALVRQRTRLLKHMERFMVVREKYLPGLSIYLAMLPPQPGASNPSAESIPLHLPSSLPAHKRAKIIVPNLDHIEEELRVTQASDALVQLRLQLTKRTYAARYKGRNVCSQNHYTRFRELQDQVENKIKACQLKYNVARSTLLNLRGPGPWENSLKELHADHIRGLGEHSLRAEEQESDRQMQILAGVQLSSSWSLQDISGILEKPLPPFEFNPNLSCGDGTRKPSWIWYSTTGKELDNNDTQACICLPVPCMP
jgi:hypothetical protein